VPMGLRYVGPVIAEFGSDWQKRYFLPRILDGEHYWAQGFSEPGAGSDLAAVATTAERDGDAWVLNGSKMWTTHAHFANWLFCLARTSRGAKPQEGITFFLVPLDAEGVRVDPIPLLAVDHEVNQVFLSGVRIPDEYRVGEVGQGWRYAKFLLELERGGLYFCGRVRFELRLLLDLVDRAAPELREDGAFAARLAALADRVVALEALEFGGAVRATRGSGTVAHGSLTKLLGTELQKDVTALAAEAAGYAGLEMVPERPLGRPGATLPTVVDLECVAMPRYLNLRAASVYGGSSEIQREILARQVLELP